MLHNIGFAIWLMRMLISLWQLFFRLCLCRLHVVRQQTVPGDAESTSTAAAALLLAEQELAKLQAEAHAGQAELQELQAGAEAAQLKACRVRSCLGP